MIRWFDRLIRPFRWIGGSALVVMMLLTCLDVVLRAANRPIQGAVELCGFLATVVVACALPFAHRNRAHARVDLIFRLIPKTGRRVIDIFNSVLSFILFGLIAWRCVVYGNSLRASGEVSMTLELPSYLLVYLIGAAFAALTLIVFGDLMVLVFKGSEE